MRLAAALLAYTGCTHATYICSGEQYIFIILCFERLIFGCGNKIFGTASIQLEGSMIFSAPHCVREVASKKFQQLIAFAWHADGCLVTLSFYSCDCITTTSASYSISRAMVHG